MLNVMSDMWLQVRMLHVNTDDGTQASISIHIAVMSGCCTALCDGIHETHVVNEVGACVHYLHYMDFTNNNNDRFL